MDLETMKLAVSALIPLVVVLVGWLVNKRLKALEHANWANQKLVERRLQLYEDIMPRLNDMYCFYMFVGNWKQITPDEVLQAKRELDKKVHVYAAILGPSIVRAYEILMNVAFKTFNDPGTDARIRADIEGNDGNRRKHCSYEWQERWDAMFERAAKGSHLKRPFVQAYQAVERAFQQSFGTTARVERRLQLPRSARIET